MQAAVLSAMALMACVAAMSAADPTTVMTAHTFTAGNGLVLPYRRWQAPTNGDTRLPLLVFLHGSGGRGDDNRKQVRDGLPQLLAAVQERHPCVLIAPQCPADMKWTGIVWQDRPLAPRTAEPTPAAAAVLGLIDALSRDLPIDRQRILLTGVSMGGSGIWDLATRAPGLFAAIMPVCGGCDHRSAPLLEDQRLWAFQGTRDDVVRPELPRTMIAALLGLGGKPRYTEFASAGHDIASQVYADREALTWLFASRREVDPASR